MLGSQKPTIEKEFDKISKDLLIPIATLRKLFKSVCEDNISFSKVIQLMNEPDEQSKIQMKKLIWSQKEDRILKELK